MIAVFRQGRGTAQGFAIPRPKTFAQKAHLTPDIVQIIFRRDFVSGCLKDPRQGIAHRGLAAVRNRQRSRRIGADKFHEDFAALPELGFSIFFIFLMDFGKDPGKRGLA